MWDFSGYFGRVWLTGQLFRRETGDKSRSFQHAPNLIPCDVAFGVHEAEGE